MRETQWVTVVEANVCCINNSIWYGSRNPATYNIELLGTTVNGFQTLNIVSKRSILDTIRILLQSDSKETARNIKVTGRNIKKSFYDILLRAAITFHVHGDKISAVGIKVSVIWHNEQKISKIRLITRYCERNTWKYSYHTE